MDAKTIFDGKPQSMEELWRAVWHDHVELGGNTHAQLIFIDSTDYQFEEPKRQITVILQEGGRPIIGSLTEHPGAEQRFVFVPDGSQPYGRLAPAIETLKRLGVYIEGAA